MFAVRPQALLAVSSTCRRGTDDWKQALDVPRFVVARFALVVFLVGFGLQGKALEVHPFRHRVAHLMLARADGGRRPGKGDGVLRDALSHARPWNFKGIPKQGGPAVQRYGRERCRSNGATIEGFRRSLRHAAGFRLVGGDQF